MADLQRAREHCFFAGVGDSGMALCEAVAPYGLAKIHHVQEQLGLPPDATFVGAPDATVTRNKQRWRQGFGYGGAYAWTGDFAVLDIKSNACGMLVGALAEKPDFEAVRAAAARIEKEGLELDGIHLDYDLSESNHFLDVLEVDEARSTESSALGARWVFIMHSSGHELRGPTRLGPGLYWDESDVLRRAARAFDTPWGTLSVLVGGDAAEWYAFYRKVQDFNHRRRERVAEALFGRTRTICNETHQGLVRAVNRANVGCYTYDDPEGMLFPLTLQADLPAWLVRGKKNVSEKMIEALGWGERAQKHGVLERLRDTNILPHGGGYTYPGVSVSGVIEAGPDARRFELATPDGAVVVESPRELPHTYRGLEILRRMTELDLGQPVVELAPRFVL
jgi:hypothetical protein